MDFNKIREQYAKMEGTHQGNSGGGDLLRSSIPFLRATRLSASFPLRMRISFSMRRLQFTESRLVMVRLVTSTAVRCMESLAPSVMRITLSGKSLTRMRL